MEPAKMVWYFVAIVVTTHQSASAAVSLDWPVRQFSPLPEAAVDPEVYMDSTELITSKGYPCENHYVTTHDGFILNMQRIPHGRQQHQTPADDRPVVILQHGFEGSSSNWLDNFENQSLAYILADGGADVWLGNVRGTLYSTNHTTLKPSQREFWAWTWDEMAAIDLPAMVDYVVKTTSVKQLHYVGHSQGTTMGFAGFSMNQTLAAFIKRFYALAPVANIRHIKSPVRYLAPLANGFEDAMALLGYYELLSYNKEIMNFIAVDVCDDVSALLCENVLFILGGYDMTHFNQSRIPVYVAHNPGGSSIRNLVHYAQGVKVDAFQMFDYGSAKANIDHYKQPTPPLYNLSNFHVPVVAYAGGKDWMGDPVDVNWLLGQIAPSLLASHNIPSWAHLDFIWAFDAPQYCYNDLVDWVFNK